MFKEKWILYVSIAAIFYYLHRVITRLIYKNPIFIICKNMLFYTPNEKWFDLEECDVQEISRNKRNFSFTLYVKANDEDKFEENFWYIEEEDRLKRYLEKYYTKFSWKKFLE